MKIGILALQGNVVEHEEALTKAAKNLGVEVEIILVRTAQQLDGLSGIILPGGESTTISKLLEKFSMFEKIQKIPAIMGTCAGLILMSKDVEGLESGQKTLALMDLKVSRNAYGSQINSFVSDLKWVGGGEFELRNIMFIRAPKIKKIEKEVKVLATLEKNDEPVIIEQKTNTHYLLGATCHPEMSTTKIHEYFLKIIDNRDNK